MKIGMVCPYDWSHPGGVRTHIVGLAAALRRRGFGVEVIAPASKEEPGVFRAGGAVGIPANGSIARVCFSPAARRRIEDRLSRGDLDVLHLHEPGIPSISLLALMASDLPSVATFHAGAPRSLGYRLGRGVLRRYLDRLRDRMVVSEAAGALVRRYFPAEYRLVPNGVDVAMFSGAQPDERLLRLKPFVLFLGRPERRKGFPVVCRAMEAVRSALDVRLVAAGPAPKDAPAWVAALGPVPDEQLPGIYAAADVFCAPSTGGESFGIVLVEAMAAGIPVVCSDLPGYREAAAGAALTAPPGDDRALASRLVEVLSNRGLAADLAARGRERASALDWEVLSEQVIEAYARAVS